MRYLELLREFDAELKIAEEELLKGNLEGYNQVLTHVDGPFEDVVKQKLANVRNEWDELKGELHQYYAFSKFNRYALFTISEFLEGYPPPLTQREYWPQNADSVPIILRCFQRAEDGRRVRHLWYWYMTETIDFTDRFIEKYGDPVLPHKREKIQVAENERDQIEEIVPGTSPFIDEYFDLSALRDASITLWEDLIRTSIRRRVRTPLGQIARYVKLKLPWVHWVVQADKPKNDEITTDLVYICKNPDFDSKSMVDIPISEEGQVIYLVICPNCGRKNEMGKPTCAHCGAGL